MTPTPAQQQNRTALKKAAVAVPAITLALVACVAGVNLMSDEPRPAVDIPTATPSPTRSVAPVENATTGPVDIPTPALPAIPDPPPAPEPEPEPEPPPEDEPDDVYYRNCAEARRAGAAPIRRGEPGYRRALDRDNDGVACD